MCFDEARAWQELDSLFRGQWENGLVPHIVFHQPADSYFPGPEQWGLADRRAADHQHHAAAAAGDDGATDADRAQDKDLAQQRVSACCRT